MLRATSFICILLARLTILCWIVEIKFNSIEYFAKHIYQKPIHNFKGINLSGEKSSFKTATNTKGKSSGNDNSAIVELDVCRKVEFTAVGKLRI